MSILWIKRLLFKNVNRRKQIKYRLNRVEDSEQDFQEYLISSLK
jgi:hypothetical protein